MFVGMFKVMIMLHVACIKLGTTVEIPSIWFKRKWSYLGRLLRNSPGDITQVYAVLWVRQARPGVLAHISHNS